ncbi:MAG: ASKHA domain-containing protein [Candidatus Marinimicrobia bacterium]|nr:ASKHA domain-containing protein [Candidatus Neomarinimicrobiota bacterium]
MTDSDIPLKGKTGPVYGAAVDLGTSTIVASLIDLRSGERTGPVSAPNPQAGYGSDIITRATAALSSEKVREALRELAAGAINRLLQRLHKDTGQIYRLVLGGNAVMTHLFAGEPLDALMTAPYRSAFTDMRTFAARETGLRLHPAAKVTVLPAIGSFIGGDISADLLVCRELFNGKKNLFLMDLGTNCELVLQSPNGVKAASAPAGPVMEGAGIAYGMSAGPGAITDLVYDRKNGFCR